MNAEKCFLTKNRSYSSPQKAAPVGIVVHSTGVNNPTLKRYVQPSEDDPERERLLKLIGVNKNKNSWNRPSVNKSTHFFIGKLKNGEVGTIQTLPTDISCWGVGSGKKGSYNYNPTAHIQFEVCEDGLKNQEYFNEIYKSAVALCAELCKEFSWESKVIVSHKEAYKKGYGSNHGDIDHWLKKFGYSMKKLRKDVDLLLNPFKEYKVKRGNSLSKIAKKNKTTVERIIELNREKYPSLEKNPNLIRVGWVLTLDR